MLIFSNTLLSAVLLVAGCTSMAQSARFDKLEVGSLILGSADGGWCRLGIVDGQPMLTMHSAGDTGRSVTITDQGIYFYDGEGNTMASISTDEHGARIRLYETGPDPDSTPTVILGARPAGESFLTLRHPRHNRLQLSVEPDGRAAVFVGRHTSALELLCSPSGVITIVDQDGKKRRLVQE